MTFFLFSGSYLSETSIIIDHHMRLSGDVLGTISFIIYNNNKKYKETLEMFTEKIIWVVFILVILMSVGQIAWTFCKFWNRLLLYFNCNMYKCFSICTVILKDRTCVWIIQKVYQSCPYFRHDYYFLIFNFFSEYKILVWLFSYI